MPGGYSTLSDTNRIREKSSIRYVFGFAPNSSGQLAQVKTPIIQRVIRWVAVERENGEDLALTKGEEENIIDCDFVLKEAGWGEVVAVEQTIGDSIFL